MRAIERVTSTSLASLGEQFGGGFFAGRCRLAIPRQRDQIGSVLERFVNEDSGRFYGKNDDLTAELAKLAQEVR